MPKASKSNILERIPDIFFRLDEEGRVLYLNDAWECWAGIPKEKVEGGQLLEHLPLSERTAFEEALEELRAGTATRKELPFHLSSEDRWETKFQLLLQRKNWDDLYAIEGLARLDRKTLAESETQVGSTPDFFQKEWGEWNARLALFPENAPSPLLECDRDGMISYLNPVAHSYLNEFGKEGALDFLPSQHEQLIQHVLRTGKDVERELHFGDRVLNWTYSKPEGYERVHLRGHDITEQKRVEAELLDAMVETQEEDRDRFSKELHEGIGQQLSAILMNFEDLRSELPPEQQEKAEAIQEHLKKSIQDVRSVSHGLMPTLLKEFGLVSALEELGKYFRTYLDIELHSEISIREGVVEDRIKVGIYRLVQELAEFASRVRSTRRFFVHLYEEDEELIFLFSDEGAEQDPATGGSMKDLRKFDSMIRSMHGSFDLIQKGEEAPRLEVRIPIR